MAITINAPTANKNIYGLPPGSNQIARTSTIGWSGSIGACTIMYSKDAGATWTNIVTGITTGTYEWDLNTVVTGLGVTHLTNIIGTDRQGTIILKVVDSENSEAMVSVNIREVSLGKIIPNGNVYYYFDDCINIDWDYIWDDGITGVKVEVYWKTGNQTARVTSLNGFNIKSDAIWDNWAPDRSFPVQFYSSGINTYAIENVCFVVVVTDTRVNSENNWIASEYCINLRPTQSDQTYTDNMPEDPSRYVIGRPIAIEKAFFPDEAVSLGQIEAGRGIIIRTRKIDGSLPEETIAGVTLPAEVPDASVDTAVVSQNIVFEVDPNTPLNAPRTLVGVVDMKDTNSSTQILNWNTANGNYGQGVYFDVVHNFGKDVEVEIHQVDALAGSEEFTGTCGVICHWERLSNDPLNAIRLYCTIKNSSYPAALTKDRMPMINFDPTYIFKYTITERFRNNGTINDWTGE